MATLKKSALDDSIQDDTVSKGGLETFLDDKKTSCKQEEDAYTERDDKR